MQTYIIIDPFTYKPIQFSTFNDNHFWVTKQTNNVNRKFESKKALCLPVIYNPELLIKTYDPETESFN
jgi:hypothetical protein